MTIRVIRSSATLYFAIKVRTIFLELGGEAVSTKLILKKGKYKNAAYFRVNQGTKW